MPEEADYPHGKISIPYAQLGSWRLWRLRGYPVHRFNDKAAIYYSAKLHDSYWDWSELRDDMNWSVGVGVRA